MKNLIEEATSYLPELKDFAEENVKDDDKNEDLDEEAVAKTKAQLAKKKKEALLKKKEAAKKAGMSLSAYEKKKAKEAKKYARTHKAQIKKSAKKYAKSANGKRAAKIAKKRDAK